MLLIDAIVVKAGGSGVANRPVYVAIGVGLAGERDVGGLWLDPAGGEGATQWAAMPAELRNRGLADVPVVCCDGLRGLPPRSGRPGPRRRCRLERHENVANVIAGRLEALDVPASVASRDFR